MIKKYIKKYILPITVLSVIIFLCACEKNNEPVSEISDGIMEKFTSEEEIKDEEKNAEKNTETKIAEKIEKGYNLPVDPAEEKEARADCIETLELIRELYLAADKDTVDKGTIDQSIVDKDTVDKDTADKDTASDAVISEAELSEMADVISQKGRPTLYGAPYLIIMSNYEKMDKFLKKAAEGEVCEEILYDLNAEGGVSRRKYIFDGADMYVLTCIGIWNDDTPGISGIYYSRIKEWEYTEKGWFGYEMCVPEPPEVTEIVDGSCLIRVIPLTEEQREMTRKCVLGLAYQGNNLLRSDWEAGHMEELDYNGLYEYLYMIKYQEKITSEGYPDGIPGEEFESLIMEYLPVTAGQIREYAVSAEKAGFYAWSPLGCGNYKLHYFGSAYPEVTNIKTNDDGTVTLTVDAVCDLVIHDDAVISHELTVQFYEDGSFRYLGNKILDNGGGNIPEYQYRLK